jgi:hypothetical protein
MAKCKDVAYYARAIPSQSRDKQLSQILPPFYVGLHGLQIASYAVTSEALM